MNVEPVQVKIRLTDKKDVLKEARRRNALKKDERGEFFVTQFNGTAYTFRPGVTYTFGENVALFLRRASGVILGNDLTGDQYALLEEVGRFNTGDPVQDDEIKCPSCGRKCSSLKILANHITREHSRDKDFDPPREVEHIDYDDPQTIADSALRTPGGAGAVEGNEA